MRTKCNKWSWIRSLNCGKMFEMKLNENEIKNTSGKIDKILIKFIS